MYEFKGTIVNSGNFVFQFPTKQILIAICFNTFAMLLTINKYYLCKINTCLTAYIPVCHKKLKKKP